MWPGGPCPPLAPIPVPPQLQVQKQALLAQQQQALVAHQQPVAAPDGSRQWVAPGYYNPVAGLPWDPMTIASAFSMATLTPSNEWYST